MDPDLAALVAALSAADRNPGAPAGTDLDAWLVRLDGPADPAEGQRVFFHPKGPGCALCHQVDGRGGLTGPELSTTAKSLTRRRLIESIVQPAKEVAPQFVPWLVARQDGTVLTGTLIAESPNGEQTYADARGRAITLKPSEIAERKPLPNSIMPDDLSHTMTLQEFRDLLAYLQGLGTVEEGPDPNREPARASGPAHRIRTVIRPDRRHLVCLRSLPRPPVVESPRS